MPMRRRRSISDFLSRLSTRTPSYSTEPESGFSSKLIKRIKVDFPAPLFPMMPYTVSEGTTRETFRTASIRPLPAWYVFFTESKQMRMRKNSCKREFFNLTLILFLSAKVNTQKFSMNENRQKEQCVPQDLCPHAARLRF